MGAICAVAHDLPGYRAALQAGRCGIGPIRNIPTERLSATRAAEITGLDLGAHFTPRRAATLDRASRLALIAAREALAHARLAPGPATAVILGASFGHETFDEVYRQFYGEGARRVQPLAVPKIMANAAASLISMEYGLRGPCFTTASACASATHAIGLAFQMVRAGMVDAAITGGADASIVPGFLKGWEGLRVLSPDTCRPFSLDRTGLVIGEGAGILIIESLAHAQARGADILGEIAGFGMSADGADLTAPQAAGAAAAMRAALVDAGSAPAQVDYVNAHGTGTRLNDRTEAAALHEVFGPALPPTSSTKSMIGHCMTAAGALELVATLLALQDGIAPPTANFTTPDPDCDLDCVPNQARAAPLRTALSNSFAFGGLNAVLAARRADAA